MSDRPIIEVENLGKRYRLGAARGGSGGSGANYQTLRESLSQGARRLLPRGRRADGAASSSTPDETEFWALRDVSFSVQPGEVVGIIGRNGAGKSTLLKILSRITDPTEGRVTLRGRVASLLEVGTGFHPELTGRENIYLNGAVLGMGRAEIRAKFDEIVAFAEVERFLDTPVKRYSSGMYVRLAFAVAAHLEPEILIVDEVLAVGDAEFQKRCLGRMREVSRGERRTVLFVSHNLTAVANLCGRAVLIEHGRLTNIGETNLIINSYLKKEDPQKQVSHILYNHRQISVNAQIIRIELLTPLGAALTKPCSHDAIIIKVTYLCHTSRDNGSILLMIRDAKGTIVTALESHPSNVTVLRGSDKEQTMCCIIHSLPLTEGKYFLAAGLAIYNLELIFWEESAGEFEVDRRRQSAINLHGDDSRGIVALNYQWQLGLKLNRS